MIENTNLIDKKVAILGGSTTNEIKDILELFLLKNGIKPIFYQSEYAQYWQDVMFDNEELLSFSPDIIYIHTSNRNITNFPEITDTIEDIDILLNEQFQHFESMWSKIEQTYHCPIIQNNFEFLNYRLLGNKDATDLHGRTNYITRLNLKFAEYAQTHNNFFINDINYQSACFGLDKWSEPLYWHMYKYALTLDAIPELAFNVANIIKSIFGKNKKAFAIDLDNTMWGGIVGDDGVENLEIGHETALGQAFTEFQEYLNSMKKQGILLNIISKNEHENAIAGLNHPQMALKVDDFISIKANWEPKSINLSSIADELTLLPESFVFCDDNPAEREIIKQQFKDAGVPFFEKPENYILAVDRGGYFETTNFSNDDLKRNEMYKENAVRAKLQNSFINYEDYLVSLNMTAQILPFEPVYMARIAQLTNKSNQFNLTTVRYTQDDIEKIANDNKYITLYGKLEDKFGDNGVVSIVIAKKVDDSVDIVLWLMSCRVLKRDMEFAMMDTLVDICKENGISKLFGYYYPTAKNKMVADFYDKQGFEKVSEGADENKIWVLDITDGYKNKNKVIEVKRV